MAQVRAPADGSVEPEAAPDYEDEAALTGKRAFLLNPPAAPSSDTDVEERATVAAIVEALEGSGLEKVVAASGPDPLVGLPGSRMPPVLHVPLRKLMGAAN